MKVRPAPILTLGTVAEKRETTAQAQKPLGVPLAPVKPGSSTSGVSGGGAGGVFQHSLKGAVDLPRAMTAAMDAARLADPAAQPALKEKAVALIETFLALRGVKTSRTRNGELCIDPDPRTDYGRYAMFAMKHCAVLAIVDPTDRAAASFSPQERTIRVACDQIESGKPGLSDLHEMVHACFNEATRHTRGDHPLHGKCYRDSNDIEVLGYEHGYARDEIMTYAHQSQLGLTSQLRALAPKIAGGAGDKKALRFLLEEWRSDPSLAYCRAFATDARKSAQDLKGAVRALIASGAMTDDKDPPFVASPDGSKTLMASAEGDTMRLSASDRATGKNMWFYAPALGAELAKLRGPAKVDAMARSFSSGCDGLIGLCDRQLGELDRCEATRARMDALLDRGPGDRLTPEEGQELLQLMGQWTDDLAAMRRVTLPPGTPLLPKGFDVLEAELSGTPLAN